MEKDIAPLILKMLHDQFPTKVDEELLDPIMQLITCHFKNAGVFVKDIHARMVFANEGFQRFMNLANEHFIGKHGSDFLPVGLTALSISSDRVVLESQRVSVSTYEIHGQYVQTTKLPIFDDHGTVLGLVGYSIKIEKPGPYATFAHFSVEEHAELATKVGLLKENEIELVQLVSHGVLNKQIASHFDVSVRSVEKWRQNLLNVLEIKTTAQLIRFAVDCERYGLLPAFKTDS